MCVNSVLSKDFLTSSTFLEYKPVKDLVFEVMKYENISDATAIIDKKIANLTSNPPARNDTFARIIDKIKHSVNKFFFQKYKSNFIDTATKIQAKLLERFKSSAFLGPFKPEISPSVDVLEKPDIKVATLLTPLKAEVREAPPLQLPQQIVPMTPVVTNVKPQRSEDKSRRLSLKMVEESYGKAKEITDLIIKEKTLKEIDKNKDLPSKFKAMCGRYLNGRKLKKIEAEIEAKRKA